MGPLVGPTMMLAGVGSVMTNAPDNIDASAPRFTAMFFGPSAVDGKTDRSILALVDATVEMDPPYVGEPRTKPGLDALKTVPAVISSPPIVSVPLRPRATRDPKPGRVRFKPVALFGRNEMSATA